MKLRRAGLLASLAILAVLAGTSVRAQVGEYGQQERGRYLATVGDCGACHTAQNGTMAGGLKIMTPFGAIYSPNITPDAQTGIGTWSDEQFYRALHEGIAADGSHLYPALPYPWFTKATRQDVLDIRAYLRTVPAVNYTRPDNQFPWPLNNRMAMAGWNELYFKAGTYQPDAGKSALWNRGAYLVEGLGHCGACHSPRNIFGAVEDSSRFQGADLAGWYAPSLDGDVRTGLGGWSEQEIVEFLKTGHIARTVAYGPMSEVVAKSTSGMTDQDLAAIAVYLKALPGTGSGETPSRPAEHVAAAGQVIYVDTCSACHREQGEGVPGMFPSLKGSAVAQSSKATTVIRLILNGGHAVSTSGAPTSVSMPSFGWKLTDQQVASVASYVRSAWGNAAAPVSASDVADLRKAVMNASASD